MGKVQKKKIDRMERFNLILFSLIYWVFYGILYGCILYYAPETIMLFDRIPWNLHQTMLGLGLALWGMLSLLLGIKYHQED
ncbi:MAG: hypothetical protein GYA14_11305 [Ignavibacteria bacterium]|nr:hypothetical protein [Ignavibacteria bacterium]